METMLNNIISSNKKYTADGKVASYIPELKKANQNDLGICIIDKDNNIYCAGDYNKKFTIQSISKTIILAMALIDNEWGYVFSKVGMEPSGDPFNSIMKLETNDTKKPCNPMINAGAIVTTSLIKGKNLQEKEERMLAFFRKLAKNDTLKINESVYKSEKLTGDRNRAMGYLLKNDGFIEGNVEEVLDLYFKQCSIEVDVVDLARIGLLFANYGIDIETGERVISEDISRIVKTFMVTCGMYDASGEFAIKVGIPAKSEKLTGDRNRAMGYLLKNDGFIEGNVEEVLDLYFKQCSIEVDVVDLARIGLLFANYGIDIETGERVISEDISRIVKTFMVTCGMYDASGEFAIKVGIPAKSGVGGGIMASVPKRMGIGVFGPALDKKGNSIGGLSILKDLSAKLELNIF